MNDERTITAIKNRNEAVINEVITKYSKLLWAVAGAVLNNRGSTQDVEECVADTFIYLWEHPDKYDPQRGKLKTWLSIVARTQAVNRCREISKRNTISLENTDFIDQLGVVDNILGVVPCKCSRKIPKNLLNRKNRDGGNRNETLQQRIQGRSAEAVRRDRREEGCTAARCCVLHAGGLAQHTPKYTAREDTERRGADDPHP